MSHIPTTNHRIFVRETVLQGFPSQRFCQLLSMFHPVLCLSGSISHSISVQCWLVEVSPEMSLRTQVSLWCYHCNTRLVNYPGRGREQWRRITNSKVPRLKWLITFVYLPFVIFSHMALAQWKRSWETRGLNKELMWYENWRHHSLDIWETCCVT